MLNKDACVYTDLVTNGDRLEVLEGDEIVTYLVVDTMKDIAIKVGDNSVKRKINRRGSIARVFVGNYPVVSRI